MTPKERLGKRGGTNYFYFSRPLLCLRSRCPLCPVHFASNRIPRSKSLVSLCISQLQLRPPLPPPPGLLRGIFQPCQSRGWGICKSCTARGPGICQPRGQPRVFDTLAVSHQTITTQRILLEKQADWLICQGRRKIEEVSKGTFSIFTHAFLHCSSSQNYIAKSVAIEVNQRFFGLLNQNSVDIIEEHPFTFIKLFMTVNFTAHY